MHAQQGVSLSQVSLPGGLAPGEALPQSLDPWICLGRRHREHEERVGYLRSQEAVEHSFHIWRTTEKR